MIDQFTVDNLRQNWHSLEQVLDRYIDMIEQGKIVALSKDWDHDENEVSDFERPWTMASYSPQILERTVNAFEALCFAIEERMPVTETSSPSLFGKVWGLVGSLFPKTPSKDDRPYEPLADNAIIVEAGFGSFAEKFLSSARKPRFKYLAPGIAIQSPEDLVDQPDKSQSDAYEECTCSKLLFRGDLISPKLGPLYDEWGKELHIWPPGLYLESYAKGLPLRCHYNSWEDAISFVLPFCIGAKGFAKSSDGGLIGENREHKGRKMKGMDTHDELYTPGYNPFLDMHNMQLCRVLENWCWMVEEGHWDVDASGVAGGIEKFKQADTKEHWEKYIIPLDW
jgi:hypothetical protein